jgi:hypothetical protein
MTANRIDWNPMEAAGITEAPEAPAKPAEKPTKAPRKRAPRKAAPQIPPPSSPSDHLRGYALAGVGVMSVMSAGLNGYAHSLHATIAWAGWALGLIIPVVILLLGKVAGIAFKRNRRTLAYCTAAAGIGLLTGSPLLLAAPMAIAIDAGFVCAEYALTIADED